MVISLSLLIHLLKYRKYSSVLTLVFALLVCTDDHILRERLTELAKDAERKKALKDVANDNTKEKSRATEATEKKAQSLEKARQVVENGRAEVENRLEGVELKLVEANSLNLALVNQIADLKAALEACENK